MARVINLGGSQPVNEGEAMVVEYLTSTLPDDFILYPNIEITEPGVQPYEYDIIVVAPHAVYVVEVKRWLKSITGGDRVWVLSSGARKPNPLTLANLKARVLHGLFTRFSLDMRDIWVTACVAIADDQTRLQLQGAAAQRTFLYKQLPAYLQDPSKVSTAGRQLFANAIKMHYSAVRDAIEQEGRVRTQVPRRIGHYEVLETLSRSDHVDEYVARNVYLPGSAPVRLRVYNASPYLTRAEREAKMNRVKRDTEALQSIGQHANLAWVRDFWPDDSGHFIEVTDWSEAGTLRDLLERGQELSTEAKLGIASGIAHGLAAAHAKGVVHRALSPENVLIGSGLTPLIMNFDLARMEAAPSATVWQSPELEDDQRYMAPELRTSDHAATPAADLYSLGAIIFELFSGKVPFDTPTDHEQAGDDPPGTLMLAADVPTALAELASHLYSLSLMNRPSDAQQVADTIDDMLLRYGVGSTEGSGKREGQLSENVDEGEEESGGSLFYAPGQVIRGEFKVLSQLGGGGFAQVYKVLNQVTSQVYAMKVINGQFNLEMLQEEYAILDSLSHPNIAKVRWAGRLRQDQYYLVMEYIDGQTLSDFTSPDNLLPHEEAVRLTGQLLKALEYIHQPNRERVNELRHKQDASEELTEEEYYELQAAQRRFLHRDIKPQNLMLTRDGNLKLIDFNISARLSPKPSYTEIGTPPYMAPDIQMLGWDESVDLFAVGVVLYELITGHHPYPDARPSTKSAPVDPGQYKPELGDEFTAFLLKAVQPLREDRFGTAHEMHSALLEVADNLLKPLAPQPEQAFEFALEEWEKGRPNYNPYVTRLLSLYSQAKRSNAGTRGLDEIARATYVPTWLDERLMPDVLAGKHRLVIITGNAGDGKTAFVQQLEVAAARDHSSTVERIEQDGVYNGSRFRLAGLDFETNYDGSQDEGAKENTDVLVDFFAPFIGRNPFVVPEVMEMVGEVEEAYEVEEADGVKGAKHAARIIAINEGRLRDFLHEHHREFPYLSRVVTDFLDGVGDLPPGMLVVNLNWRAVIAGGDNSIFSRQLRRLVAPEFWTVCESCEFRERCFLKGNAARIGDLTRGTQIVERARSVFEIAYLRRKLHITMRDLRSALSYMLLRDHNCDDVAALMQGNAAPIDYLENYYFNAFASSEVPARELAGASFEAPQSADRLVKLLSQSDLALWVNPGDDRDLYFADQAAWLASPLLGFDDQSYDSALMGVIQTELRTREQDDSDSGNRPDNLVVAARLRFHAMMRRKSYYERRDEGWREMLPYTCAREFVELVTAGIGATSQRTGEGGGIEPLRSDIALAISTSEGMRHPGYAYSNLALRAASTPKSSLKSFRLFPVEDFRLRNPSLGSMATYLEYVPDHFFFEHVDGNARLAVSLDLFELLRQIGAGTVPSPADIQGYFLNLSIFKNALTHFPYREGLLTEDDRIFYRVFADERDVLHLQLAEGIE